MTHRSGASSQAAKLRRSAEKRLQAKGAEMGLPRTEGEALRLLHELRVHQMELELQNEELRRSREELEASRDRYGMLYDFAPIGYFTIDREWTIRTANLTGADLLGIERKRLVGCHLGRFMIDRDLPTFADFLKRVFSDRETHTCELTLSRKSNEQLWVQMKATASESDDECLVAVIDVSASKRAEEALRRAQVELEQRVAERTEELAQSLKLQQEELAGRLQAVEELRKNELMMIQQNRLAAMGEMLTNIAHQWRQPLNVLGLKVQEIRLSYELGGFSKELLDANVAKAMDILKHLSQTIDVFRDFSAPDKGKGLFSVNDVVAKTVSLIEDNFTALGIAIEVSSRGEPQINGYLNQFAQVLLNILVNAKDAFLEKKTVNPRITICSWAKDNRAVVTITDNAGGIEGEILNRIFDPYFTTKELGKGTGIGLFMSKTIIEKSMGGRLTACNVEGGAQFRIEL